MIKNCANEDLPIIDDIEMGQFFYKGKRNIMLNITAVGNAVDICLDVEIATGNFFCKCIFNLNYKMYYYNPV